MKTEKNSTRVVASGLELVLRPADDRDIGFCYELMSHNMRSLFDKNTQEKWSRTKFKHGYEPHRIRVIEHDEMPVGFYDYELVGDQLYWHNVQLSEDYRKGIGTRILELIERSARDCNAKAIIGKVFTENSRIIKWLQKNGYVLDKQIEEENSYWVKKDLEVTA
jgi:RimJ/RimL family protein N-acetyltransferase